MRSATSQRSTATTRWSRGSLGDAAIFSVDWLKGKSTGNHVFSYERWGVPANFPLNQSTDI